LASAGTFDDLLVFDIVEESDNYTTEEQRADVDRSYDAE
jgi:hypothetical protein